MLNIWSDFVHLASNVTAKNSGPLLHKYANVLHVAVDGVDGHCGILYDDFACASRRHGSIADSKGSSGSIKPCSLVLGCGHGDREKMFDVGEMYLNYDCCE
jgi:hypothetical protein